MPLRKQSRRQLHHVIARILKAADVDHFLASHDKRLAVADTGFHLPAFNKQCIECIQIHTDRALKFQLKVIAELERIADVGVLFGARERDRIVFKLDEPDTVRRALFHDAID